MNKNASLNNVTTDFTTNDTGRKREKNECSVMWKRNCPSCGKELFHTRKSTRDASEKSGVMCHSCRRREVSSRKDYVNPFRVMKFPKIGKNNPRFGVRLSPTERKKMSERRKGQGTLGWFVKKYGVDDGTARYEHRANLIAAKMRGNKFGLGYKHTPEQKLKFRVNRQKHLQHSFGTSSLSYNSNGCKIINEYGRQLGTHFRHAENEGELTVCGYSVDGYSVEKNIVIEIDETHHFKRGKLRDVDVTRMNEIKSVLGCKFIRIRYNKDGSYHEYLNEWS